jgi:hypothetical protein
MTHKSKFIQINYIFLLITLISIFFGCAPKDPAAIASKVAVEWSANNIDVISKSIAGLIINDNPLIGTAITMGISKEINQRIAWEYATPRKLAEDKYGVVTTAYTEIELPLLGKYKVSVNYNLEIDTKEKRIISADMDASSFAMIKQ